MIFFCSSNGGSTDAGGFLDHQLQIASIA